MGDIGISMDDNKPTREKKICFIALGAYPLLAGGESVNITGPDVHQVILARELVKHGYDITFITYEEGGKPIECIGGIKVIKAYEADSGSNRMLKAVCLLKAMVNANADIYFQHGGVTGIVSLFCRVMSKRFVYHIGSDALVDSKIITRKIRGFNRSRYSIDRIGNWVDIKLADTVIVQNEFQKKRLNDNYKKKGVLIKKPIPPIKQQAPGNNKQPIILWVGAIAEVKQPELFVNLAKAVPQGTFYMIGGHSNNQELYNKIKDCSKKISNLDYLGVVPFDEIDRYFSRASILVNTSMFEAYPPYGFIQAWSNHTAVVSIGDNPDAVIEKNKMGLCSKSFNQLVRDVKMLLKNETLMKEMGANGVKYVEKEHDIRNIGGKYRKLFNSLS